MVFWLPYLEFGSWPFFDNSSLTSDMRTSRVKALCWLKVWWKNASKANLKIKIGQFHYIQTAAIPLNPHTIWHLDSSWIDMVVIELNQLQVSFWSWTFCNSTHLDHETDVKVIRPACSSSACNMACNHLATRHDSIMDHWTSCWPTNGWFLILHGWIHVFWKFSGGETSWNYHIFEASRFDMKYSEIRTSTFIWRAHSWYHLLLRSLMNWYNYHIQYIYIYNIHIMYILTWAINLQDLLKWKQLT